MLSKLSQAYKEVKKRKPPFVKESEPVSEPEPQIPEELLCMVCRNLLQDAVLIPCCGNSFCNECVRQVLLESDIHECPLCHEKDISPDTVIPNRFLRTAVLNFKNETGYTRIKKIAQISSPHPVHVESPQHSPISTVENQPVQPLPNSSEVIYEMHNPSSSNQDNPDVFQETAIEQSIGISDVQPGTPLADERPFDILPENVTNERISHEQSGDRHSYEIEPVFSEYSQDVDPGSTDEKVSSSEHQNINPIITRGWHHQPLSNSQKFPLKKPHHRDVEVVEPSESDEPRIRTVKKRSFSDAAWKEIERRRLLALNRKLRQTDKGNAAFSPQDALCDFQSTSRRCASCKKTFSSRNGMLLHKVAHMTLRPFKCSDCLNTYKTLANLKSHRIIHSSNTPYKCPLCGNRFKQQAGLTQHMKSHRHELSD